MVAYYDEIEIVDMAWDEEIESITILASVDFDFR
jgi:hypothetical protein